MVDIEKIAAIGDKITPFPGKIAVLRDKPEEKTESGLYIPESNKQARIPSGIVLAVGEEVPDFVVPGSVISFSHDALHEITVDDETIVIVDSEKHAFAVIE